MKQFNNTFTLHNYYNVPLRSQQHRLHFLTVPGMRVCMFMINVDQCKWLLSTRRGQEGDGHMEARHAHDWLDDYHGGLKYFMSYIVKKTPIVTFFYEIQNFYKSNMHHVAVIIFYLNLVMLLTYQYIIFSSYYVKSVVCNI